MLVGHSVGGVYAELFAAIHPEEVAGLVLVDPTGLDDALLAKELLTSPEYVQQHIASWQRQSAHPAFCLDRARKGEPLGPPASDCVPGPTGDPIWDEILRRQLSQVKYFLAYQSEMANFWPRLFGVVLGIS